MKSFTRRVLTVSLALLLPIQLNPFSTEDIPQNFDAVPGEPYGLNVTTDKYTYDVGEDVTVTIKNDGNHSLYWPCYNIFWFIFDEDWNWVRMWGPICATAVRGLAPGGSENRTWNQTYYILNETGRHIPPTWEQVPDGLYHANTSIYCGSCEENVIVLNGTAEFVIGSYERPVADAGGPYVGYEGESITFDASKSKGEFLEYRWDFGSDGTWDTGWSTSPTATYTYGDDFSGLAKVEVQTKNVIVEVDIDHWKPSGWMTTVSPSLHQANSFIPSKSTLASVDLDVGINWGPPDEPLYVSIRKTLNGPNLTTASVTPVDLEVGCGEIVNFDFPDISVTPGETYWIVIQAWEKYGNYQMCGTDTNYPDGRFYHWHPNDGWFECIIPDIDLRFRTYSIVDLPPEEVVNSTANAKVDILNLAPALAVISIPGGKEGASVDLEIEITDPGSDDLKISWWGECTGLPSSSIFYPNDPKIIPDPYPSPDINPREVTNVQSVICGDNGDFQWNVKVEDDDGGVTTMSGTMTFMNTPPEYAYTRCPQIVGCNSTHYEGEPIEYWVIVGDAGSDDITLEWTWGDGTPPESSTYYNDGVGPDPPSSPDGTYPFQVDDARNHSYGDDGKYPISVEAEDDDGGVSLISADVTILNLPPSLSVTPPQILSVLEGTEITLQATATEPGSDDLTFTWSWEHGKSESHTYYNDGVGPDPPESSGGTFPFEASDSSTHTYGDDCGCLVTLTVEDDDGGKITYTTSIDVVNVPPIVDGEVSVYVTGDLTLRVAGEKWHDVVLTLFDGDTEMATASVLRVPGSPDDQSVTIHDIVIDLLNNDLSAVVEYTPLDDPVNGQINGGNPAWLIFTPHDGGEEYRLHHTFNVRHPDTWKWNVEDFNALMVGVNISFEATASDVGSDDLTFKWEWGDSSSTLTIYYNDGLGPDNYPSPDVNPITVTDQQKHAYIAGGPYTVLLTVADDDGGSGVHTIVLTL